MLEKAFEKLNLPVTAAQDEVNAAYTALKKQYGDARFQEGDAGTKAARDLEELELAYGEIVEYFRRQGADGEYGGELGEIDALIKAGQIQEAQEKLDAATQRPGQWHYLQSVVYYKRGWMLESKKQLELAMAMEPHNQKFSASYEKLALAMSAQANVHDPRFQQPRQPGDPANPEFNTLTNCCCPLALCYQCMFCC